MRKFILVMHHPELHKTTAFRTDIHVEALSDDLDRLKAGADIEALKIEFPGAEMAYYQRVENGDD